MAIDPDRFSLTGARYDATYRRGANFGLAHPATDPSPPAYADHASFIAGRADGTAEAATSDTEYANLLATLDPASVATLTQVRDVARHALGGIQAVLPRDAETVVPVAVPWAPEHGAGAVLPTTDPDTGEALPGGVVLTWTRPTQGGLASGTEVERKGPRDADFAVVARLPASRLTWSDTDATWGHPGTYAYRLAGVNSLGRSQVSARIRVGVGATPGVGADVGPSTAAMVAGAVAVVAVGVGVAYAVKRARAPKATSTAPRASTKKAKPSRSKHR